MFLVINTNTMKIAQSAASAISIPEGFILLEVDNSTDITFKKVLLTDGVYAIIDDTEAITTADKTSRISALNTQTWTAILTHAQTVYPDITINVSDWNGSSILILAAHSTYQDMVTNPSSYVGSIFADTATVLGYAQPKLTASSEFGIWRLGVLAQEAAQKAAILNG